MPISKIFMRISGTPNFVSFPIEPFWNIYGVVELLAGVSGRMDNVAHFAHLGGMIWGFLLLKYWKKTGKIFY